jgi:hypothetical protein
MSKAVGQGAGMASGVVKTFDGRRRGQHTDEGLRERRHDAAAIARSRCGVIGNEGSLAVH